MEERPLGGGAITAGVVRIGYTVRRPAPANELARAVLVHLERAGFDAAPRLLGVDEQGREILSWIEGDTFTDRSRMHPYIGDSPVRVIFTDEQVASAMRLLRRYHHTFDGDVICHGDYGPWNLVWREGLPCAVIDFDSVYRGPASEDVGYALRMFIGYGLAEAAPGELANRTRSALAAYGVDFDVPAILHREYELAEGRCRRHGWSRQLERLELERAWLAANRDTFASG